MRTALLVLIALLVCGTAEAAKAVKPCTHCRNGRAAACTVAKPYSFWDQALQGFRLTAGFRWDQECPAGHGETNEFLTTTPKVEVKDPFFVGAELRLPLAPKLEAFGNFDRDFVDAPRWNARAGVSFAPWGR